MSALEVTSLSKRFDEVQALDGVSFDVAEGEFFCIVGPTNAGKSTLLKTVAGIYRPNSGSVAIGGRDVTEWQPKDRRVSLLFQNIALFPTMTGFENIAFPLRTANVADAEVERRVRRVAELLKIGRVLERLPRTFSGGEQQRVAIGRAIIQPGSLLLLDEPLSNLDARIRIALRIEFKKLHRETGQAMVYVTHDQVEAMSLSDRVAVLHEGRFQQIGSPDDVYQRPANRFVARFIGTPPMNLLDAELDGATEAADEVCLVGDGFRTPLSGIERLAASLPKRLSLGVRPEDIRVAPVETSETPFAAEVFWIERLGNRNILDIKLGDVAIKAVVPPDHPVCGEGGAWLGFTPLPHRLLDRETGMFFR